MPHKMSEKKLYREFVALMFGLLKVNVLNRINPKNTSTPMRVILGVRFLLLTSLKSGISPGSMRPIKREMV